MIIILCNMLFTLFAKMKQIHVLLNYCSGTLASNGQKFDASRDRGRPFSFVIGIGQVIRGWDEGVMQMSLGEKAMLHITSDYGYGARGAGGVIPPNADLNFEGLCWFFVFCTCVWCMFCHPNSQKTVVIVELLKIN